MISHSKCHHTHTHSQCSPRLWGERPPSGSGTGAGTGTSTHSHALHSQARHCQDNQDIVSMLDWGQEAWWATIGGTVHQSQANVQMYGYTWHLVNHCNCIYWSVSSLVILVIVTIILIILLIIATIMSTLPHAFSISVISSLTRCTKRGWGRPGRQPISGPQQYAQLGRAEKYARNSSMQYLSRNICIVEEISLVFQLWETNIYYIMWNREEQYPGFACYCCNMQGF